MKLSEWLKVRGRATQLAKALNAHIPDVWRWGYEPTHKDYRPIPVRYGAAIERATNGQVTRKENFDNWREIWPELIEDEKAA